MANSTTTASSNEGPSDVAELPEDAAGEVTQRLQDRLISMLDLQLTLKHVHWNVVGPNFISVHEMLDPQVDKVREMSDELAERIATCGGVPAGTPGAVISGRRWEDYSLDRASTEDHLVALDAVYAGIISDHRKVIGELESLDPVSQDLIISHSAQLELFAWFIRSHLGR